jgi:hypothetical protein
MGFSHHIIDFHFGIFITEAFSIGDTSFGGVYNLTGIFNWLASVGFSCNADVFRASLFSEIIAILFLILGRLYLFNKSSFLKPLNSMNELIIFEKYLMQRYSERFGANHLSVPISSIMVEYYRHFLSLMKSLLTIQYNFISLGFNSNGYLSPSIRAIACFSILWSWHLVVMSGQFNLWNLPISLVEMYSTFTFIGGIDPAS